MIDALLSFAIAHWLLVSGLFVTILAIILNELTTKSDPGLAPHAVVNLINHHSALIVDLSGAKEYNESHIINALNSSDFKQTCYLITTHQAANTTKKTPIILTCKDGVESKKQALELHKKDFHNINFLAGGLSEWKHANLPLVRGNTHE